MGRHRHLDHALLYHLSQVDYESVDETILLPTEYWPESVDDVLDFRHEELVGVAGTRADIDDQVLERASDYMPRRDSREEVYPEPPRYKKRIQWREAPEYKAFLARYPELRRRARQGIDSIFAYFQLTPAEADVWSLAAAGYTHEWIAGLLRYKPGGVAVLLDSVESKIHSKLARLRFAKTGSWTA